MRLFFGRGNLVGVVGSVGVGKSSLLAALLGELDKTNGRLAFDRSAEGTVYMTSNCLFVISKCGLWIRIRNPDPGSGSGARK
jgi:ABC-type branched-subunit amino acid transport system ATPase component